MTYTVKRMAIGANGVDPSILLINTNNTVAEVLATGYLGPAYNYSDVTFSDKQIAMVYTTDGGTAPYGITVDSNGIASLEPADDNPTAVNIHDAPVVDKHFAAFYGTDGTIQDLLWEPSEPSYTKVVMLSAAGAPTVNYIAKFIDTNGSIAAAGGNAINLGDIIAGSSLVGGKFVSYPVLSNKGSLVFEAKQNAADYTITVNNRSHAQASTRYIPDVGASADFLLTALASPDANANLIAFSTSVGTTALNSGAVTLFTSSGTKQYRIVSLSLNFGANLSVGNKNLSIGDGTTVYSVIPTASLTTLVNATWGSAAVPFPAAAAIATPTAAGASLTVAYSGGTTNYTGGATVVISGLLQRVA